jgi:hypothetical protein
VSPDITLAREALAQMLGLADIHRVVSVDDRHGQSPEFDSFWAMVLSAPDAAGAQLGVVGADEIRDQPAAARAKVEQIWESWAADRRRAVRTAIAGALDVAAETDDASLDLLSEILTGHDGFDLVKLTMLEWRGRRESLLADGITTLALVDRDFTGEGLSATEGLELVKSLLAATPAARWLCGLLLRTGNEQQTWEGLGAEDIEPERVVVISKDRLLNDPVGFARRVKMTLLAPECRDMTKRALGILARSHEGAAKSIEENVHLYDYEHIVFVRSQEEGVWEPDTLFRLYGVYAQREARIVARADGELVALTERIRRLVAIDTGDPPPDEHTSWKIQRTEMYEDPEYLRGLFVPLELGDIFERAEVRDRRYILVSQPCDLMLRGDGNRRMELATLVPVWFEERQGDPDRVFRLPYYQESTGRHAWVDLGVTHHVSLDVLDLCVTNMGGAASYRRGTTAPTLAIEPVRARYEALARLFDAALSEHKVLVDAAGKGDAAIKAPLKKAAGRCLPGAPYELARPKVEELGTKVAYPILRVGRLNYGWAQDLLLRFVQHQGRLALDMELGRPRSRAKPAAQRSMVG